MKDYDIPREGHMRDKWEIIGDRVSWFCGVLLMLWLFWACLRVPV